MPKRVAVPEHAGLVTKERRGREQVGPGEVGAPRRAAGLLTEPEDIWRHRVCGIEDVL